MALAAHSILLLVLIFILRLATHILHFMEHFIILSRHSAWDIQDFWEIHTAIILMDMQAIMAITRL